MDLEKKLGELKMRWCTFLLLFMSGSVLALESWQTAVPLPEPIRQTLLLIDVPEFKHYEFDIVKLKGLAGDCFKNVDERLNKEYDDTPMASTSAIAITYSVPDNRAIIEFSGPHEFMGDNWFNCKLSDSELAKQNTEALISLRSMNESTIQEKEALIELTKQWKIRKEGDGLYASVISMSDDTQREWMLDYDTKAQKMYIWLPNAVNRIGAPIGSQMQKGYSDFCKSEERMVDLKLDNETMIFEMVCFIDETDGQWSADIALGASNEQNRIKLIQMFKSKSYVTIDDMKISAKGFTRAYNTIVAYYQ